MVVNQRLDLNTGLDLVSRGRSEPTKFCKLLLLDWKIACHIRKNTDNDNDRKCHDTTKERRDMYDKVYLFFKILYRQFFSNFEKDNGKKLVIIHFHELDLNVLKVLEMIMDNEYY